MRIAVISDIHGDVNALRHVLAEVDRIDAGQIWCLGDIVGLGATDPAAVVDLVRDVCTITLAGNHDRWVTGQLSLSMLPLPRQRAQLQWQNRVLSDEQLAWLEALPSSARDHDVELWHGSAQDPVTAWISSPPRRRRPPRASALPSRARRAHPPAAYCDDGWHEHSLRRTPDDLLCCRRLRRST
jgi:Calcineurin-like phosphoesterase